MVRCFSFLLLRNTSFQVVLFSVKVVGNACKIQFLHTNQSTFNIFIGIIYIFIPFGECWACWAQHIFYVVQMIYFFRVFHLQDSHHKVFFSFNLIRMKHMHAFDINKYANWIQYAFQLETKHFCLLLEFEFFNFNLLLRISSLECVQIIGAILNYNKWTKDFLIAMYCSKMVFANHLRWRNGFKRNVSCLVITLRWHSWSNCRQKSMSRAREKK